MDIVEALKAHTIPLKCGEYDGGDIMRAYCSMKYAAYEITRLREELEAARVDAERYRWLRENALGGWNTVLPGGKPSAIIHTARWSTDWREKLDAAIDAARG